MTAVRGWQLSVDWSGGGGYTGTLEDVTNYANRSDVTVGWGRPTDSLNQNAPTSELSFGLINRTRTWDRYFSPENTSSPIYGQVIPGKSTRFTRTVSGYRSLYSESAFLSLAGWSAVSGGTLTRVASPSEDGNGALSYVPPGATATVGVNRNQMVGFMDIPASQFIISIRAMATATHSDVAAVIDWYDSSGTFINTGGLTPLTTLAAGVWTTVQSNYLTPPAAAVQFRTRLRLGSTPPATTTFYVDSVSVVAQPLDADKTYVLHQGILDDLSVDSQSAARTFTGHALDVWGRPQSGTLSTQVFQGIRTGDAINIILTEIGWTGDRAIDAGATVIPYWWEEGTDPVEAVDKLVRSEGPPAIAYVEGGVFVFRDRHHRIRSTASNTSQGLFSLIQPAGTGPGYDFKVEKESFQYDHGMKSIVNKATFSVGIRKASDFGEVWSSDDAISMLTGEVTTIFAETTDPVMNVISPNFSNGSVQINSGNFAFSIDRTSGQRIAITITCTSGGVIGRMALQGNAIPVVRTVQASASDAGSIARNQGASAWPGDVPWANQYDAQAIADKIVTTYADNRPRISFALVNFNDRYSSEMCSIRIGDRITVRNDVLGFTRDFHVEQLQHSVSRWQLHRLTVSAIAVEPTQPSNVFTFGVAGKGFNDGAFGANGIDNSSTMFIFNQAGQGFGQGLFAT